MRFVTGTDPATSRNAAFPAIVAGCAQASTIAQAPPRPTLQSLAPDGKIVEFLFSRR